MDWMSKISQAARGLGSRTALQLAFRPQGLLLDQMLARAPKKGLAEAPTQGRAAVQAAPRPSPPPGPGTRADAPQAAQGRAAAELRPSTSGVDYLKGYEKFRPNVYTSDGAGRPTIGWGHLVRPGEDFSKGLSDTEAEELFRRDLEAHAEIVRRSVKVPLTQSQFDALASLAYNIPSAFRPDTGLMKALNSGDYQKAADEMLIWNKVRANGKMTTSPGLSKRRLSERNMFLNGVYDSRH